MDDKTHAAYLADLDYFQTQLEQTGDINLYYPIASISSRLGNHDNVISAAQDGLRASPFYWQLQVLLAEAYIHVGRKDEAKEILYEAIVSDEDNYKALKLLGMICRSENDRAGTLKYLRTAYLYAPEDNEIYSWLEEIGGLPISGVSEQIPSDDSEFGDFDNDITFSFDVDKTLNEARDAIDEVVAEITGKPIEKKAGGEEPSGTDTPETAGAAEEVDLLAGNEISDDDILSALGGGVSAGAAMALSDSLEATEPIPAETADTVDSASESVPEEAEANEASPSDAGPVEDTGKALEPDMFGDAEIALPGFADIPAETPVASDQGSVVSADENPNETEALSEIPDLPVLDNPNIKNTDISDIDPFMAAAQDFAAELLAEKEEPELPEDIIMDLSELESDPVDDLNVPELPELAAVPGEAHDKPEAPVTPAVNEDEIIDETALQAALDSFSLLPEEDAAEAEEDDRLEPIIPKNLVDEVLQESGLDPDDPYGDDELIDSVVRDREADKKTSEIAKMNAELGDMDLDAGLSEIGAALDSESLPENIAPLDPGMAGMDAELGELNLDAGISEIGSAIDTVPLADSEENADSGKTPIDEKVAIQLSSTLSQLRSDLDSAFGDIPDDLPALIDPASAEAESEPMLSGIDQELDELVDAGAVGAGIDELSDIKPLPGSLDDEVAKLWGEDEPVDPEVAKLWAEALEEERTDLNDLNDEKKGD